MKKRVVLALGGNAILQPGQVGSYENQKANIEASADSITEIIKRGHELVIVHGNGPQVGQILRQNELAKKEIPVQPLPICSSESQGFIGYMLQESLKNRLPEKNVATVLTMTEVDLKDEAFKQPTKPIGSFYTEEESKQIEVEKGWVMGEDAGRGYRRLVPSPKPKTIVEVDVIRTMLENKIIVVSTGGGGIPVAKNESGQLEGVAAVIDKDSSALKLSEEVDSDVLMILTDVPNVYINYGKPNQEKLETISIEKAEEYYNEGHFSDGSMGPKMAACIEFAKQGKTAIICSLDEAADALEGKAGTRVVG
ncbi:carbamate kinase [Vagococcus carniphilus]|uniref:Carbamate kinase n=1 Tax=Vagococcus carniphilus TaxID=218144 RepID=A0AAW8U6H5_9ENTE|nr:carbamate kinase [Vagococcus carniphilus]MDT2829399.1 carbamate kinase [Vagococcus carniphilus]MDT2833394.1 carbamate kinase [Vagococcus carniphilus]MDT2852916.1 carbamate kinase [Vagococcus carniphilus]